MEIRLTGQTFYWDEVMNNSNKNDNAYNLPGCKYVKGNQYSPMHQNGNTYHWCCNHNNGKGVCVVHLPDDCKVQRNQTLDFKCQPNPKMWIKLQKKENVTWINQRISRHPWCSTFNFTRMKSINEFWMIPIIRPYRKTPELPSSHHEHLIEKESINTSNV